MKNHAQVGEEEGGGPPSRPIWVRHAVFPITLVGGLLLARVMLDGGAPPESVVLLWFVMMPWVAWLERWMPRHAAWNHAQGDLLADVLYLPTSLLVGGALSALWGGLYLHAANRLQEAASGSLWPAGWTLAAQVAFACVLAELFAYWAHRWMHAVPLLWRFHAIHHSPARVYWLNAARSHPGEHVFRGFLSGIPLAVAGAPAEVLAYVMVISRMAGLFQHANVDFALGPFGWIFSIGELHRWHHSAKKIEADHNFGDTFIFWDSVFGTRYLPADRPAPEEVGLEGLESFPRSFAAQMVAPFRYSAIERESRLAREPGAS